MSTGVYIKNDFGTYLLNENWSTYTFYRKETIVANGYASAIYHAAHKESILAIKNNTPGTIVALAKCAGELMHRVVSTKNNDVGGGPNVAVTIYEFVPSNFIASTGQYIAIYDDEGNLVYDASRKPIKIKAAVTIPSPPDPGWYTIGKYREVLPRVGTEEAVGCSAWHTAVVQETDTFPAPSFYVYVAYGVSIHPYNSGQFLCGDYEIAWENGFVGGQGLFGTVVFYTIDVSGL